jgi:hypothetical protein
LNGNFGLGWNWGGCGVHLHGNSGLFFRKPARFSFLLAWTSFHVFLRGGMDARPFNCADVRTDCAYLSQFTRGRILSCVISTRGTCARTRKETRKSYHSRAQSVFPMDSLETLT